jgi:hypothetical protein
VLWLVAGLVFSLALATAAEDTATPLEHQVKAAFLFNFAKFVEWPREAAGSQDEGFVICVVDDDDFAEELDRAVSGKTVEGHVLQVRRLQPPDDARNCRILYLGSLESPRHSTLLKSVRAASVLTVGNAPGFTRQGGIINFILADNRVRFEINPDAAERARLHISSKLLQLATIVHDARKAESER